jgi:hypothetical protein
MNFFSLLSSSDYNWALRSVIFGAFFYWGNVTFGAFYLGGLRRLPNSPKGRAGTASGRDRIGSCGYLSQIQCHVIPVKRKMLDLQHQYNNCTTIPHMRVGPTYWGPPSCEGLLYSCCIGVVQESNPP